MKSTTRKSANPNKAKSPASRSGVASDSRQKKTTGVKAKVNAADGLRELFIAELKDIYWAEKALTKAIPKLIKNATSEELVQALSEHLAVTEEHVTRLTDVFSTIGEKAVAKKCEGMVGLIKEGEEIMKDTEKGVVRDAGIISAAQKVEHYEISSYGTLCAFAKTLGEHDAASILQETLDEEKKADATLSEIAESSVNEEAINSVEGSGKSSSRMQPKGQENQKRSRNKSNGDGMSKGTSKKENEQSIRYQFSGDGVGKGTGKKEDQFSSDGVRKSNEQGMRREAKATSGKQTTEMVGSRKQTNATSSRMIAKEMSSRNKARETSSRNQANAMDSRKQVRNPRQK
jgi:ferritin-like metal-binding protein YciE